MTISSFLEVLFGHFLLSVFTFHGVLLFRFFIICFKYLIILNTYGVYIKSFCRSRPAVTSADSFVVECVLVGFVVLDCELIFSESLL